MNAHRSPLLCCCEQSVWRNNNNQHYIYKISGIIIMLSISRQDTGVLSQEERVIGELRDELYTYNVRHLGIDETTVEFLVAPN
jgi:hypothetical protein